MRSVAASSFLPAFVYEIGNGAIAPITALTAVRCGASTEVAALMLALPGIGLVLGDLPSSTVANRVGDRRMMTLATVGAIVALLTCYFARSLIVLGPGLLLIGVFNAAYYLGRQSYLVEVIPVALRARAMSSLAGSHRVGLFCGPFIGAAVISLAGFRAAYLLAIACAGVAGLLLLVIPDVDRHGQPKASAGPGGMFALIRGRRQLLLTLGTGVFAFSALRAIRQVVIPLWAVHIGVGPEQTSLVFGIATAVEISLFYPAGWLMDRFGRLAIGIPSPIILGLAMMLLPLTHSVVTLALVAMLMSAGNGIGAGIQLTIGADLAPPGDRVRFLSLWRLWTDTGQATGPLALSGIAAALTLAVGVASVGLFGIYAAAALAIWLPRYSPFATRSSIRAHRARSGVPVDEGQPTA